MKIPSIDYEVGRKFFLNKKAMTAEMFKYAPTAIKRLKKIDDWQGETFNIVVNAIGTAAVAPIFIAYNPLAKTDENTKKYSAMRQPISAVLAVVTQAGVTIPWSRMLDNWSNTGKLGQYYSQEAFQDAKYLARKFKKENPGKSAKEIDMMVKEYQADQYGKLYAGVLKDGKINVGGKDVPEADVRGLISDTCDSIIKKNNEMLKRYGAGGEKYTHQVRRADFLFNNSDMVTERLSAVKKDIAGLSEAEVEKYMADLVKKSKADGTIGEMARIFAEDLNPKGDKKLIMDQIDHIIRKTENYRKMGSFDEVKTSIAQSVKARYKEIEVQQEHFKSIKQMIADKAPMENIIDAVRKTNSAFDNIRVGVVDKYISSITKRMKYVKAMSGLVVSLAIMPITCCALNWIYPRFMDKFFPHLTKSKKEGGNK